MRTPDKPSMAWLMRAVRPSVYPWVFVAGVCGVLLSACGWIQKGVKAMTEDDPRVEALTDFTPRLKIEEVWSGSVGNRDKTPDAKLLPLVQGDAVFVSSDGGRVDAFAASGGKRLWQHSFDVGVTFGIGAGGQVLMIGTADGEVIAFSAAKGEQLWRKRLTNNRITAISRSHRGIVLVRDSGGGITALRVEDAEQLWSFATELPTLTLRGMSVPYLHGDFGFIGLDDGRLLMVLLDDGRILQEFRIGFVARGTDLDRLVDIDGQFLVYEGVLYVTAYRGQMMAIDIDRRSLLWLTKAESYVGLEVDDEYVYLIGRAGAVRAFDRFSGEEVWSNPAFAVRVLGTPLSSGGFLVVGDDQGYLYWLSRTDGSVLARKHVTGGAIVSAPVAWRDRVIALGLDGDFAAARITARMVARAR